MKRNIVSDQGEPTPETSHTPLTVNDLMALPEGDGWRYELHEGRLVRKPVAGGGHDYITFRLAMLLGAYVDEHGLGAITLSQAGYDVTMPQGAPTVYIPDLAFVRAERVPAEDSPEWSRPWKLAPDLVVEVVSPSQFRPEMEQRARDWITHGAHLVWLIWPAAKEIDIWHYPLQHVLAIPPYTPTLTLGVADTLTGRPALPDFSCPVAEIFKGVPRKA